MTTSGEKISNEHRTELISLLGVYASQFSSYTTLVWQVPALSLTAQSFLLVIALGGGNDKWARFLVALLSAGIALASYRLMHDQRGHAINHGRLAKRISEELGLKAGLGGSVTAPDGVPPRTDAEHIWTAVDKGIYALWISLLLAFVVADVIIMVSVFFGFSWIYSLQGPQIGGTG